MSTTAKQHYVFLDGMRGGGALVAALLHSCQVFHLPFQPMGVCLAVDFFFCLSGFVMAYAYESRIVGGMKMSAFAINRMIRLYPMMLLGIALGAVVGLASALHHNGSVPQIFAFAATSLVLFPLGLFFQLQAYPTNNPMWSLFFEFAANAVYFFDLRRRNRRTSQYLIILVVSAIAWIAVIRNVGSIADIGYADFTTFSFGVLRIFYPFLAGVLMYRYSLTRFAVSLPAWLLAVILLTMLLMPLSGSIWVYEAVCAIIVIPLLVCFGAKASCSPAQSRFWLRIGNMAYPFYLIHQPIMRAFESVYTHTNSWFSTVPAPLVAGMTVVVAIICAHFALTLYDEPLRRWLVARDRRRRQSRATEAALSA